MRHQTKYIDIDKILNRSISDMQLILDTKLVGVYLYGSLVTGDFDKDISDIDVLAVIASDLDNNEFAQLQRMHHDIVTSYPAWNNRIEIAYVSTTALKTYKSQVRQIAIISPGEPFHTKEAGKDWLINWWVVREQGVALFGPAPTAFIDPISKEEFLQAVLEQATAWRDYIRRTRTSRLYQAYAILTMCRALYARTHGEQASKKRAAEWAAQQFPAWSALIQNALAWREAWRETVIDHEATFPEVIRFVNFAIQHLAHTSGSDPYGAIDN